MKQLFIIGLLALSVVACKKKDSELLILAPRSKGRVTFLQKEMVVQVAPDNTVLTVPVRLTRRDRSRPMTTNVSIFEEQTTAIFGQHYQLYSVTDNDRLDGCYTVAEFAPGDSLALFPILLSPERITEPMTISLYIPDTYYPEYMDEKIRTLTIRLEPAKAEAE